MSQIDWLVLSITFVTSLFASLITGMFLYNFPLFNDRTNRRQRITQQQNMRPFKPSDTNTKNIHKHKPHKHTSSSNINTTLVSTIPLAPVTPPTSINKMYWMDGKWQQHTENRFVLINSNHFDFKQETAPNHSLLPLLMELIPSLSKDTLQIIYSFISDINLSISKYALLDYKNKYIQFFINDLDCNQYTKTLLIPINSSTFSTQQLLNKISDRYVLNTISSQPHTHIECNIYFHDNHNAIIVDKYFILSLICDSLISDIAIQCDILCQFKTNNINIIQQINLHWTASLWSSKLSSFALSPLLDIRFDGKYIYAAKDNILSVNSFDSFNKSNINVLQNVISKQQPNNHSITCYRIYDCYLMVSRDKYHKFELYKIDSNNIRYLYHQFELALIFEHINNEYHSKFDINGRIQTYYGHFDTILGFEMNDDNIVFCVYYNKNLNRLFVANIKLSIFEEPKLINYNLLDGKIGKVIQNLNSKIMFKKCLGIESIYTNNKKDWLVFFECENPWHLLCEIEFRINANDLTVKYGKRKTISNGCRYLTSGNRKQMSLSCFM